MKFITPFVLLLLFGNRVFLFAQELVTDRPDFTESVFAVSHGIMQLESGMEYERDRTIEALSYPMSLLRIGLGANLELRLGLSGWTRMTEHSRSMVYLNDLFLETKYQITNEGVRLPLAILLSTTLPVGDEMVSSKTPEFGLKLATAYDFSQRVALSANLAAVNRKVEQERIFVSLASLSLGFSLNDRLGAFVETWAEMAEGETGQPVMDAGLTFLLPPDSQLDIYFGKGLNEHAVEWLIGAGYSYRFAFRKRG